MIVVGSWDVFAVSQALPPIEYNPGITVDISSTHDITNNVV